MAKKVTIKTTRRVTSVTRAAVREAVKDVYSSKGVASPLNETKNVIVVKKATSKRA